MSLCDDISRYRSALWPYWKRPVTAISFLVIGGLIQAIFGGWAWFWYLMSVLALAFVYAGFEVWRTEERKGQAKPLEIIIKRIVALNADLKTFYFAFEKEEPQEVRFPLAPTPEREARNVHKYRLQYRTAIMECIELTRDFLSSVDLTSYESELMASAKDQRFSRDVNQLQLSNLIERHKIFLEDLREKILVHGLDDIKNKPG